MQPNYRVQSFLKGSIAVSEDKSSESMALPQLEADNGWASI